MKISCGVMNDLLPLYHEGLLGAESTQLVQEHLAGCPQCTQALERMKRADVPAPGAQAPLRAVGAKLKRDGRRRIGMAVALVIFLGTVLFYHVNARQYLRYTPELVEVTEVSPGKVVVEGRGVSGVWSQVDVPTQEELDTGYSVGTTVYLSFFGSGSQSAGSASFTTTFEEAGQLSVYYAYPGEKAVPLYGPAYPSEGVMLLPRLALNYYWMLAVIAAAVLAVLLLVLYRKAAARRVLVPLLCLPLCYVLAHFAIKGTNGASWDMVRDLAFILISWASLSAAVLLALRQRRLAL